MALAKLGRDTVLELRSGIRYQVRAGTTDLGVINEAAFLDPYLGPGHVTLDRDSVVVDVGANIGDFAVQAARRCPEGRVIAVEPLSSAGRMIAVQAGLNNVANITWVQAAIGAAPGETTSARVGGLYHRDAHGEAVRVLTLPALVGELALTRIDLLKLDCEGAEWELLPAAEEVMPRIQQICMEFHRRDGWTPEKLAGWLQARGFAVIHTTGAWNGLLWARRGRLADKRE
jgi:FkbM family methyltransferase